MLAEITLTPSESKKLISMAILKLPEVQRALNNGIVALHPSSNTVFIYKEILGQWPQGLWVCGLIAPVGLCGSLEMVKMREARGPGKHDPGKALQTWFFKKGILQKQTPLNEILNQMGPEDVYIKAVNALDPQGNAGVLYSNPSRGGTIGVVLGAQRKKKFHLLLAVGLEKLIPISIAEASQKAKRMKVDWAMGMACGLIPVSGEKIDEVRAFDILTGTNATPIAAGGLGGAEGSIVLALDGTETKVQTSLSMIKTIKGAKLPVLNLPDCDSCHNPGCYLVSDRGKAD
ncbi:MAG: hypothetical protein QME90_04275 [Thermodesulfobacteriota bacterium]|nr:hypothetical protein [Thermodesulfobacteriota bacterium]